MSVSLDEIACKLMELENLLKQSLSKKVEKVYVNAAECERLLCITRPTLLQLLKDDVIEDRSKDSGSIHNKYLLSEILWLKTKKYKGLSSRDIIKLKEQKKTEYCP